MPSRSELKAGLAALTLLLLPALPAAAAETSTSDVVIIRPDVTVDDDVYAVAVRVVVEGVIDGDLLVFAAEEVVVEGEVTGSLIAVAPRVTVRGVVGGPIRVLTGSLEVAGTAVGDLVGVAADTSIGGSVGGDVLFWGLRVAGTGAIGGSVEGTMRRLELAGSVGGDVDVTTGSLVVTGPLRVAGDLGYRSERPATGLDQAEVDGVTVHRTPLPPNIRVRALGMLTRLLVFLTLSAAALLVAWSWPERTLAATAGGRDRPGRAFGYGAMVVFSPLLVALVAGVLVAVAPPEAGLPLLLVLGPVVLFLLALVLAAGLVAGAPVALLLGRALPGRRAEHIDILLGSSLLGAVWLLPVVGWLVPVAVLPFGLGCWMVASGRRPD